MKKRNTCFNKEAIVRRRPPRILEATGDMVITDQTIFTKCPPWTDTRFKPDPDHIGEFTLEWQLKRIGGRK